MVYPKVSELVSRISNTSKYCTDVLALAQTLRKFRESHTFLRREVVEQLKYGGLDFHVQLALYIALESASEGNVPFDFKTAADAAGITEGELLLFLSVLEDFCINYGKGI